MKDIKKPDKPEIGEGGEKYEFNLGLYRIETLSEILKACAKKYKTAIIERDRESVMDYQAMVNLLYTESYIYMEEETGIKMMEVEQSRDDLLEDYLDDFSQITGEQEIMNRLTQVREIYLAVRKLLQEVGIDIPRQEKMAVTDTFQK